MKKTLLFVGLMLALSLGASAQDQEFSFGLRLGPNFTWTASRQGAAVNEGTGVGFDMGFVAEYYFTENYAIVSGVNVNFVKGHYSFDDKYVTAHDTLLYNIDRQFRTTVYEIPLMLKLVTPEIGGIPLRAYAQLGGAFGITPSVKVKNNAYTSLDGNPVPAPDEAYLASRKGEYNPIHASLRVGAGAEYALLESTRVFLGFYYSYDFLNSISSGAQGITSNYRKYYCGNEAFGQRPVRLDFRQHRIGVEVGILF